MLTHTAAKFGRNYLGRERSVSPVVENRTSLSKRTAIAEDDGTEDDEEEEDDGDAMAGYLNDIRDMADPNSIKTHPGPEFGGGIRAHHGTPTPVLSEEPESMDMDQSREDGEDIHHVQTMEEIEDEQQDRESSSGPARFGRKSIMVAKKMLTPLSINKSSSTAHSSSSPQTGNTTITDAEKSELLLGRRISRED